jgi:hypothetical protein
MIATAPGVKINEKQRKELDHLLSILRPEEIRDTYHVRLAARRGWEAANLTPDTIAFMDGEERTWYIRPDGSSTWRT